MKPLVGGERAPARTIRSVIDLHAHVLPGVDDGPASLAESLEILRDAAADGVTRIAATPHVRNDYPTAPATVERRVAALPGQRDRVVVVRPDRGDRPVDRDGRLGGWRRVRHLERCCRPAGYPLLPPRAETREDGYR